MFQIHPRIDRHFDIEHGGVAGPDGEAIGRRRALAVEQRVHDDGIGACRRLLDPERLEEREFLALRFAGVDGEPPRRQAVQLSLGHGAEIARAEKDADLVVIVGLVDRRMKAKAGKAEVHRGARRRQVAERKQLGLIDNF